MTQSNRLSLNDNWHCLDPEALVGEDDAPYQVITDITHWHGAHDMDSGQLMFKRTFHLEALDYCVRYELKIAVSPPMTAVYMGDAMHYVGQTQPDTPFTYDVTNFIHLGENALTLIVTESGAFGAVMLEAVPCD